jgi:hypothetical protein
MTLLQKKRDLYIKDENIKDQFAMGLAYEAGYRDACRDAKALAEDTGWFSLSVNIGRLPERDLKE